MLQSKSPQGAIFTGERRTAKREYNGAKIPGHRLSNLARFSMILAAALMFLVAAVAFRLEEAPGPANRRDCNSRYAILGEAPTLSLCV